MVDGSDLVADQTHFGKYWENAFWLLREYSNFCCSPVRTLHEIIFFFLKTKMSLNENLSDVKSIGIVLLLSRTDRTNYSS